MSNTRCDLHLHSSASVGHDDWYTRYFGCPESYAEPARQYELCKTRGMTLVTLTDHDTIAGGLTLVDKPDFFLSEEVTSQFPENGCVIHVLAWNITPEQHEGIQATRADVYRLVEYMRSQSIAHAVAHPLHSPNWKLDVSTLEKILLLFPALESVNGRTDFRLEADLSAILAGLDSNALSQLARKHGLTPARGVDQGKILTAGSDDHEHRRCASCYTEVPGECGPDRFFELLMAGAARVHGRGADIASLGLAFSNTTYHYFQNASGDTPRIESPFVDILDVIAGRDTHQRSGTRGRRDFIASMVHAATSASLRHDGTHDVIRVDEQFDAQGEDEIATSIMNLSDVMLGRVVEDLLDASQSADFYRLFAAFHDAAGAAVGVAPFCLPPTIWANNTAT